MSIFQELFTLTDVLIHITGSPSQTDLSRSSTIMDILPELTKKLQIPHLEVGLSLKRLYMYFSFLFYCT